MNPFLPVNTGTGSNIPTYPQGAVSTSATSGMPATYTGLLPYQSGNGTYSTGVPGGASTPSVPATSLGTSQGAGSVGGVAQSLGFPTNNKGQNNLFKNLQKTYGAGIATTLMNFLSSGAGYNQTAINNLVAGLQPGFNLDQQNLLQNFSAGGNRFSSGAQLGLSNLEGQEQLDVGQLETQMYEQSVQDYINVMMGAAGASSQMQLQVQGQKAQNNSPASILQGITGGAQGISSLVSAINPNADTSILDAIGAF